MSGIVYSQRWCGQSQPHDPHTWAEPPTGVYMSCAGHSASAPVIAPGPCLHDSGVVWNAHSGATVRCELLAGHAGAHTATRPDGGESVWIETTTTTEVTA